MSSCDLAAKSCVPCKGGVPPLEPSAIGDFLSRLGDGWTCIDNHHLEKEFRFANFVDALAFTNRIGQIAEEQGHHPDIFLAWGRVKLQVWTHKIKGLTESDFVFAAKVSALNPSG